jgi:glycosyltransferase involved in cell wall biosynthesis
MTADAIAPHVSVVLPVYNEVGHLEAEIRRIRSTLEASPYRYEVIVVDDGSTDGSAELLRTLDGIHVISFAHNRGSGSARRAGTKAARGEVVVWTDVDMTYPNDAIPTLVKELEGHDQVVGARRSEEGTAKAARVPAKWLIRRLAAYLAQQPIPDLNSGFRAFRADVARQFLHRLPHGFSCVTTMTMTFLSNGYSVKYVPIDYSPRAGESKFHWLRDTRRYFTQVIRLIMSYEPLRIFVPVGIALALLGGGKLVYDVFWQEVRIAGNTLLILFAAFQVFAIGLLADLVVQVNRPEEEVDPAQR